MEREDVDDTTFAVHVERDLRGHFPSQGYELGDDPFDDPCVIPIAQPIQPLSLVLEADRQAATESYGDGGEHVHPEPTAASRFDLPDNPARPTDLLREPRLTPATAYPQEPDVAA